MYVKFMHVFCTIYNYVLYDIICVRIRECENSACMHGQIIIVHIIHVHIGIAACVHAYSVYSHVHVHIYNWG